MKVLIAAFSDRGGGAARAAYRLHDALRAAGVASRMKVRVKRGDDASVEGAQSAPGQAWEGLRIRAGWALRLLQRSPNTEEHSPNLLPSDWASEINASDADVVNLHWLGEDTMSIADIGRLRKPVVWTLHDMWAFCGAEHYADPGPQARWRQGYDAANRPPRHRGLDLDRLAWQAKKRAWQRPFQLVTPSAWLEACAASSALLGRWPRTTIPNALDTRCFAPTEPAGARRALGLPLDVPIVLFGGGAKDPRKGLDLLRAAVAELPALLGRAPHCVAFGDPPPPGADSLHWLGAIDDDARLALLYSAADVTVVPSRLENLPQGATEAQACGCPVVAFDVSGLPDAVEHERTGFLARPYSASELARGIAWVLADRARHARLREAARERALRLWSPQAVVPRYLEAYAAAISSCPRG